MKNEGRRVIERSGWGCRRLGRAGGSLALACSLLCMAAPAYAQPRSLECLIEPQKSVVVSAPVIGVVSEIHVERGDFVEKGQVLAALDSRVEKAAVELARARAEGEAELQGTRAQVAFNKRRFKRGRELRGKGVMSEGELDEIESQVLISEANVLQAVENRKLSRLELERAQAALELRTIKSPVNGVVVELMVSEGEYVDPPQVMEIAEIDPLRVEAYAPVSMLGAFELGMKGQVTLESRESRVYDAQIVIVDGVVDAASGTFGVRLQLPNPDKEVLAGLSCRVEFPEAQKQKEPIEEQTMESSDVSDAPEASP